MHGQPLSDVFWFPEHPDPLTGVECVEHTTGPQVTFLSDPVTAQGWTAIAVGYKKRGACAPLLECPNHKEDPVLCVGAITQIHVRASTLVDTTLTSKISGMAMQVKADLWEKIFPSIRIIYFMTGSFSAESAFLRTHQA